MEPLSQCQVGGVEVGGGRGSSVQRGPLTFVENVSEGERVRRPESIIDVEADCLVGAQPTGMGTGCDVSRGAICQPGGGNQPHRQCADAPSCDE